MRGEPSRVLNSSKEITVVTNETNSKVSRRIVLRAGVFGAAAALAGRAAAQQKIAQPAVLYQATPKGDQECDKCVQFEAPSGCKVVAGTISPKGWCVAYAAKPTK